MLLFGAILHVAIFEKLTGFVYCNSKRVYEIQQHSSVKHIKSTNMKAACYLSLVLLFIITNYLLLLYIVVCLLHIGKLKCILFCMFSHN